MTDRIKTSSDFISIASKSENFELESNTANSINYAQAYTCLSHMGDSGQTDVEATSVKADAAPNDLAVAINNFCLLYNIDDRDKIEEKLSEVYDCYNQVLNSEAIVSISENLYDLTDGQKMRLVVVACGMIIGMR